MLLGKTNGPPSRHKQKGNPINGAPANSALYSLSGFVQLDANTLIAVTSYQHCILRLDRRTSNYQVVAGTCGSSGLIDGPPGTGKFQEPCNITHDINDNNAVIISDKRNNALRKVELNTGYVTTIVTDKIKNPASMFQSLDGTALYVSNMNHVAKITKDGSQYRNTHVGGHKPSMRYDYIDESLNATIIVYGYGIVEAETGLLFVADMGRNRVQIMDLASQVSKPACRGMIVEPRCVLMFPTALHYDAVAKLLYMGDTDGTYSLCQTHQARTGVRTSNRQVY